MKDAWGGVASSQRSRQEVWVSNVMQVVAKFFSIGLHSKARIVLVVAGTAMLGIAGEPVRGEPVGGEMGESPFQFFRRGSRERKVPESIPADATRVSPGFRWKAGRDWAWLLATLEVPEEVDGKATRGLPVGLRISCAASGEVYVNGELRTRYDNDKPACVIATDVAQPGATVAVAIHARTPMDREDDNEFSEASWVLLSRARVLEPVELRVDLSALGEPVPDGLVGLSQGGMMADYEDATASKLRQARCRWFRMDNVLTSSVKRTEEGLDYDFSDLDRRVDFIRKVGADPILCVSYMPEALDAIPDPERHSAPKSYAEWETLCYEAAKHCLERNARIPFWEVWNEPNTGWIKPGPDDAGSERFESLYSAALGKPATDRNVVRTFEAYLKLYAASARGVLRADPSAKIGGPALASGPFENDERGHCINGRGFARGLLLWCQEEKLPLDFISWHEYFHPPEVFRAEVEAFRQHLEDFPDLKRAVSSWMVTEWNEAWWADPPQDNELGAAWCANTVIRAFLPAKIDRPCFFYAKQGDDTFRGDYGLLMKDNVPKPQYHVVRMLNTLTGRWVEVAGEDSEVASVAAWDADVGRLAIVLVNHTDRYNVPRTARLLVKCPRAAKSLEYRVDATHSNVWHDREKHELEVIREADWAPGDAVYETRLPAHSVSLIEFLVQK